MGVDTTHSAGAVLLPADQAHGVDHTQDHHDAPDAFVEHMGEAKALGAKADRSQDDHAEDRRGAVLNGEGGGHGGFLQGAAQRLHVRPT